MQQSDKAGYKGYTDQLRGLGLGETLDWPYSLRKSAYTLAGYAGIAIKAHKKGDRLIVQRVSILDQPRLITCQACGYTHWVNPDGSRKKAAHKLALSVSSEIEDI